MSNYHSIGLSTDYHHQSIPYIFEAVTNRELNISMVIAQYNDMVMQLAALREAVEQAREFTAVFCAENKSGKELYTAYDRADTWLAAHPASQPQDAEEQTK